MKLSLSFTLAILGEALAHPSLAARDDPYAAWAPAGPDDGMIYPIHHNITMLTLM